MVNTTKEHIGWVDLLRITACFLVVLAHCCDPFVAQFDNNRFDFLSGTSWGSLVRPCVPLFVMMTGVLLMPVREDMTVFYKKRIGRILIPLIFWSLLTPLFYYLYLNGAGVVTVSPNIVAEEHTLSAMLTRLYTFVFNFSYATIPLWYLYMLIGIYLIMPVVSAWLHSASQKDVKLFLKLWIASMCLPYFQMVAPSLGYVGNYGNMGVLGVCDWNPYGTFYYFSGFLGYVVLAWYLKTYPLQWSSKRIYLTALPLFVIGYLITLFGFLGTQKFYPGNYAYLEIVWYFSGINVFMMTYAVYIVMSNLRVRQSAFLAKLASLTFGIYLCHFFIVQVGYDLFYGNLPLPPYLLIPVNALFSFSVSAGIVWVMSRNRFLRRFVF